MRTGDAGVDDASGRRMKRKLEKRGQRERERWRGQRRGGVGDANPAPVNPPLLCTMHLCSNTPRREGERERERGPAAGDDVPRMVN